MVNEVCNLFINTVYLQLMEVVNGKGVVLVQWAGWVILRPEHGGAACGLEAVEMGL